VSYNFTVLAVDTFNRANESPLNSATWTIPAGNTVAQPIAIVSDEATMSSSAVSAGEPAWEGWIGSDTWGPNQYASIQIDTLAEDGLSFVSLLLRTKAGANGSTIGTQYTFNVFGVNTPSSGVIFTANTATPGLVSLGVSNLGKSGVLTFVPGAKMVAGISGNNWFLQYNGQIILSGIDNQISKGTGTVQLALFDPTPANVQVSNFSAGTLMSYTIKLNGPIQVFDSNNNTIFTQPLTGISVPVTDYSQGSLSVSAAAAAIPLPATNTNFAYLQNVGTATAVVSWTPQGGSGAIVQDLGVSSAMAAMQVTQSGVTGVTAITVSCAAATTVSYILGG